MLFNRSSHTLQIVRDNTSGRVHPQEITKARVLDHKKNKMFIARMLITIEKNDNLKKQNAILFARCNRVIANKLLENIHDIELIMGIPVYTKYFRIQESKLDNCSFKFYLQDFS